MQRARVNNHALIGTLLRFAPDKSLYYHIELIGRKKDGIDLDKSQRHYGDYFVTSEEMYSRIFDELVTRCDLLGCRAYINLNPKSKKRTAIVTMQKLLTMVENDDYSRLFAVLTSAAGSTSGLPEQKTFVVDVDLLPVTDMENKPHLHERLARAEVDDVIAHCKNAPTTRPERILAQIPTLHGFHLITQPFDISDFNSHKDRLHVCTAEVKTNSPTLLYANVE